VRIAPCNVRGKLLGNWIDARAEILTDEEAVYGMCLLKEKYKPWKQLLDFFAKFGHREHVVFAIRPEYASFSSTSRPNFREVSSRPLQMKLHMDGNHVTQAPGIGVNYFWTRNRRRGIQAVI
jgi:hypothetical protein